MEKFLDPPVGCLTVLGVRFTIACELSSVRTWFPSLAIVPGACSGEANVMLVLSRKKNESIVIDGVVKITVVEVRGDKVRLGIEAPREVPIHRSEVYDAIRRSQAEEANTVETNEGA